MSNCKNRIDEVREDYNEWFTEKLWGTLPEYDGMSWFAHTDAKFRGTFADAAYQQIIAGLPPILPADSIVPAASTTTQGLRSELDRVCGPLVRWAIQMTAVASRLQATAPQCTNAARELNEVNNALSRVVSKVPPENSQPNRVCNQYLKWARAFNAWGRKFSNWEQKLSRCLGLPFIRNGDLAPPPWPPWKNFDDSETRSRGAWDDRSFDLARAERLAADMMDKLSKLTVDFGQDEGRLFPHGITEVEAKVGIEGQFEISLKLKGPDQASASTGSAPSD